MNWAELINKGIQTQW